MGFGLGLHILAVGLRLSHSEGLLVPRRTCSMPSGPCSGFVLLCFFSHFPMFRFAFARVCLCVCAGVVVFVFVFVFVCVRM